jgi:rhamnosyltransferase
MIKGSVIAVVVVYNPKAGELDASVKSLLQNFKEIVVVWNGPHPFRVPPFLEGKRIHLLDMGDNVGLARALNVGMGKAFELGAAWVYLSDQDSTLPPDFSKLMIEYSGHIPKELKVGAIGPRYFNLVTRRKNNFSQLLLFWKRRINPRPEDIFILSIDLITSGSFISETAFKAVGPMREELFIDMIDIEWILRAKRLGFDSVALTNVMLYHHLGDYEFKFFWTSVAIHSPLRVYYYFRNTAYLYTLSYIFLKWKLADATRNIFRFLFYVVLVKPRLKYMRMALLGIYHGLTGRMGKF